MLKRKALGKYTEKKFELMQKHLCKYINKGAQEDLHHFRVETKKLKAFIGLIEHINNDAKIHKLFKPIEKLFDHAGIIRSAHVELLLLKRYHLKNASYSKKLQDIILSETSGLKKNKNHYLNSLKESEQEIQKHITSLSRSDLIHYTGKQLETLQKYFSSKQNISGIHKSRILLKKLFYNYSLFDGKTQRKLNLNINYLNTLQEQIGNWHDITVIITSLSDHTRVQKQVIHRLRNQEHKLLGYVHAGVKDFSEKVNNPAKTKDEHPHAGGRRKTPATKK